MEAFSKEVSFELGVRAGRKNPARVDPDQNDGSKMLILILKLVNFLTPGRVGSIMF